MASTRTMLGNIAAKATGWPGGVNDLQFNKRGTVGTEPISKGNKKYTEVKAGRLGKLDVPMGSFKKGGKVKKTGTYKLHKGERVLNVKQTKKFSSKKK